MSANILRIIGETADQRPVYGGVFQFHETTGLPLDVVLEGIQTAGGVPCWVSFVLDAVEAGMSEERALSKLESAIVDSFGSKFAAVVMRRLREHDVESPRGR